MNYTEMTITKVGNDQLYIPLSKKLAHKLKQGDKVSVEVKGKRIIVEKI